MGGVRPHTKDKRPKAGGFLLSVRRTLFFPSLAFLLLLEMLARLNGFQHSAERVLVYANLHRKDATLSTTLASYSRSLARLEEVAPCAPCAPWRANRSDCAGCSDQRVQLFDKVAQVLAKVEPHVAKDFAEAAVARTHAVRPAAMSNATDKAPLSTDWQVTPP